MSHAPGPGNWQERTWMSLASREARGLGLDFGQLGFLGRTSEFVTDGAAGRGGGGRSVRVPSVAFQRKHQRWLRGPLQATTLATYVAEAHSAVQRAQSPPAAMPKGGEPTLLIAEATPNQAADVGKRRSARLHDACPSRTRSQETERALASRKRRLAPKRARALARRLSHQLRTP